jgi:nucleoside-diphosphate-sugar epimerase
MSMASMSTSSVLVTGAAGFIGAHVAARVARQGHRVVVDVFNHCSTSVTAIRWRCCTS